MQGRAPNLILVPFVATVLLGASACDIASDDPEAQYAGICVDQATEQRLPDEACGDYDDEGHGSHVGSYFLWIPMHSSYDYHVPPVGARTYEYIDRNNAAGMRTVPKGTPLAKGVPSSGGKMSSIQRGGFGAAGKAGAGKAGGSAGS